MTFLLLPSGSMAQDSALTMLARAGGSASPSDTQVAVAQRALVDGWISGAVVTGGTLLALGGAYWLIWGRKR